MAKTKALNNLEAIREGLIESMRADENIIMYGQDIGNEGGVFRTTAKIQKEFGPDRIYDAPIAEAAIVGTAIGSAIYGLRPVVEIQFQGFSYPSFQQIMTHAARMRNRSRGRFSVPLVIRMPMSGGIRALEHHSEAIEAMYAHVPGIKVVMPSTPYDSKGLIVSAIKDNDTVIFLEPKKLYRSFKQEVPEGLYEVPIGKANVIKEGSDLTVVTYGAQVHDTIKALQLVPDVDVEIIDLRTIKPIDTETIIESVKKTGRVLVVHEAVKSFSTSGEIIARVNEGAFEFLKAPPTRLTGYDITIPLAKGEAIHAITPEKIAAYIKKVYSFEY